MAQFAKATFDAAGYLAFRPTYPPRVYEIITAYHRAGGGAFGHALDLGCGPGFMALNLAPTFTTITALDPSAKMVSVGLQPPPPQPHISYRVGSAEDLRAAGVPDASVDLVVAGQAAHWFDHAKSWGEIGRVLRPRGSVAYAGYGEMTFPAHPALNAVITRLLHGTLGPYWSQPGRSIVEGLLDAVPFPVPPVRDGRTDEILAALPDLNGDGHPEASTIAEPAPDGASNAGGAEWDAPTELRLKSGTNGPWHLTRTWTPHELEGYFRTCSALHAYHEKYPEDKAKGKGEDVVGQAMREITPVVGERFEVAWPFVLVLARKK